MGWGSEMVQSCWVCQWLLNAISEMWHQNLLAWLLCGRKEVCSALAWKLLWRTWTWEEENEPSTGSVVSLTTDPWDAPAQCASTSSPFHQTRGFVNWGGGLREPWEGGKSHPGRPKGVDETRWSHRDPGERLGLAPTGTSCTVGALLP